MWGIKLYAVYYKWRMNCEWGEICHRLEELTIQRNRLYGVYIGTTVRNLLKAVLLGSP